MLFIDIIQAYDTIKKQQKHKKNLWNANKPNKSD